MPGRYPPVTPYTDVTAREETVTHGERGNQVRNGQVRQQIILILFFKNKLLGYYPKTDSRVEL
jgi:hypothetical protein